MTVMWALEADTVEYGEYLTGVRTEGLTYSLFSFPRKCGQASGGSIPAFILGLSGYIANQEGILFTDPRDRKPKSAAFLLQKRWTGMNFGEKPQQGGKQ